MKNHLTWKHGMLLVRNIVGGVDYKGCREIMKLVLDCFDQLPRNIHERNVTALHSGREVILLSSKEVLLLSYIIISVDGLYVRKKCSPPPGLYSL